jgi:hypothetical protein
MPTLHSFGQLDCQFQMAEAIHIDYKGLHDLTTGELLKVLQSDRRPDGKVRS